MQYKKSPRRIIFTIVATAIILLGVYLFRNTYYKQYYYHKGVVFGTTYHITYEAESNKIKYIDSVLNDFDNSLSSYNKKSIISKLNRNEEVKLDLYFKSMFQEATHWFKITNGAFDITVTPLIDAWGFGSGKKMTYIDSLKVDSLIQYVGMDKVSIINNKVVKTNKNIKFNVNAIAKGYGVDVVANFLEQQGITNYLVEIGGEIRALGKNAKNNIWTTAINKPIDDSTQLNNEIEDDVILVPSGGMATSGNYRNFYIKNGKKYAHTIDPKTGYPVSHNLLSATVIMPTCMAADALATAFMVLGLEKSKAIANRLSVPVYFIYDNQGKNAIYISPEFKAKIKK